MNYVLLKNVKWSYVHGGIFRTKSNIHDETFFTSFKPYFKNVQKSVAHLEAFWIKQDVILHVYNVLGMCRGVRVGLYASYAEAWDGTF